MSKPKIILIGAGGHAHACIDVIEQHGQYQIAGLVGKSEEMHTRHFDYSVIATDVELPQLSKDYQYALITVGQIQSPDHRIRLYKQATELGFHLPAIIAPSAHISSHAAIGAGTIVMHGVIVNAGAMVGKNCIINTRALIEHDATVADNCHISTGAILNGNVHIEAGSFVGSGSVIKQGITIRERSIVGLGISVQHNYSAQARFMGNDKS
jgi:sugar O-acyltransferase (sialic acid O-acetyltransferase NeuD family)